MEQAFNPHIVTKRQSKDDHAKSVRALRKESKPSAAASEYLRALDHALYWVRNGLHPYTPTKNTSKPTARNEQRHTVSVHPSTVDVPPEAGVVLV